MESTLISAAEQHGFRHSWRQSILHNLNLSSRSCAKLDHCSASSSFQLFLGTIVNVIRDAPERFIITHGSTVEVLGDSGLYSPGVVYAQRHANVNRTHYGSPNDDDTVVPVWHVKSDHWPIDTPVHYCQLRPVLPRTVETEMDSGSRDDGEGSAIGRSAIDKCKQLRRGDSVTTIDGVRRVVVVNDVQLMVFVDDTKQVFNYFMVDVVHDEPTVVSQQMLFYFGLHFTSVTLTDDWFRPTIDGVERTVVVKPPVLDFAVERKKRRADMMDATDAVFTKTAKLMADSELAKIKLVRQMDPKMEKLDEVVQQFVEALAAIKEETTNSSALHSNLNHAIAKFKGLAATTIKEITSAYDDSKKRCTEITEHNNRMRLEMVDTLKELRLFFKENRYDFNNSLIPSATNSLANDVTELITALDKVVKRLKGNYMKALLRGQDDGNCNVAPPSTDVVRPSAVENDSSSNERNISHGDVTTAQSQKGQEEDGKLCADAKDDFQTPLVLRNEQLPLAESATGSTSHSSVMSAAFPQEKKKDLQNLTEVGTVELAAAAGEDFERHKTVPNLQPVRGQPAMKTRVWGGILPTEYIFERDYVVVGSALIQSAKQYAGKDLTATAPFFSRLSQIRLFCGFLLSRVCSKTGQYNITSYSAQLLQSRPKPNEGKTINELINAQPIPLSTVMRLYMQQYNPPADDVVMKALRMYVDTQVVVYDHSLKLLKDNVSPHLLSHLL